MEESRQARLRLEQSKSTAASVLRQQVFHFDPVAASNAANAASLVAGGLINSNSNPQLLQLGIGVPPPNGINVGNVGGNNIPGNVPGNSGPTGRFGNNVRLVQEQLQRQGAVGNNAVGGTSLSVRTGRMSDEHSQEEMLRSYFPGWF